MSSDFYDMDGNVLDIGDYCEPVEGRRVYIVEKEFFKEYNEDVLIGQQVLDPDVYSPLTHADLAANFRKVMP